MKKQFLLTASLLTAGLCLAAPLTPEQALSRLSEGQGPGTRAVSSLNINPALELRTIEGQPAVYVFEQADTKGFMVVSADDMAPALLGYSDENVFDLDNISPAMQNWLDQYAEQIQYMRERGITISEEPQTRVALPDWSPISPLVKTSWDQDAPYNNDCPMVAGSRGMTGCVATAMAQVMNYHKYPEKGQGSISYRSEYNNQALSIDFSEVTFDWANMINSYSGQYTDAQANAVATLMKAAGYAVQMTYYPGQSGAVSGYIPGALIKYFNYDPSAQFITRNRVGYVDWATLIYNNLKNVGPVIYDGDTDYSGGHSFVCDGYRGNGYFHFNWGWSGSGDGYFLLDALDPAAVGSGAISSGFNFTQDAVFNIQKPKAGTTPSPSDVMMVGSVDAYASGNYIYIGMYGAMYPGFRYYGNEDSVTFNVGVQISEVNNPSATPYFISCSNMKNQELDPGYVIYCAGITGYPYPTLSISSLDIADNVKYKFTVATQQKGGEWTVAGAPIGSYNYFYLTKKGDQFEIENFDQMQFTCNDLQLDSPLYDGNSIRVNLTLANNNDITLSRGANLLLLDASGKVAYIGDSFVSTLEPGEKITKNWTSTLSRQISGNVTAATDFYLALYDIDTETIYYQSTTPVTMEPNPGAPRYSCSLEIKNEDLKQGIYQVANSSRFTAEASVACTRGIFSYPVVMYVMQTTGDGRYVPMATYYLDPMIIEGGQSESQDLEVTFPGATVGDVYYLGLIVNNGNTLACQPVAFMALANGAGVEAIGADNEIRFYNDGAGLITAYGASNVEVYTLTGMKVNAAVSYNSDAAEINLSDLGKGVVVITATNAAGERKSLKIAL